jgi:hypothetical protein
MTDVDELVRQARSALESGNRLVARGYWRRAARVAPDRLDIWEDLCRVTELPEERRRCLEHIVALNPDHTAAQEELERMRQEEVTTATVAAAADETADPTALDLDQEDVKLSVSPPYAMRPDVTDEMRRRWDEAVAAGETLVCIDHPQRETSLRCNRCGAPICTQCAVRTPVGFRCRECVRAQQAVFYTVRWYDYPVAAALSLLLSVPAAILTGLAGWWFALILSPLAGGLIGGLVQRAVGMRRGRWIWLTVGACIVSGALVAWLFRPSALISIGIYAVTATGAAVGMLRLSRSR